jgi:hypothetical protein
MKFQPKTEEELQHMGLIDAGVYPFQVMEAVDKKSKSGNDMIEIKIKIWDSEGRERQCFDYLLESMAFKLRHFCETTGLIDKYNLGQIQSSDCIGKSGNVELIIQQGKQKPEGGYYPDKNSVKDYIKSGKKEVENSFSDDIPF